MVRLGEFDFDALEKELENEKYTLLYLDYDRANGVRLIDSVSKLSDEDKNNFYKIVVFNKDKMITVYNMGKDKRYSRIDKEDFAESMIKEFYTDLGKKLVVRMGTDSNGTDIFQYMELEEGDR